MNTRHARLSGFTLIELLIVVSIIGVLAGMVSVGAPRIIQMVKRHKARTEMQELEVALARYKQDCGIYPDDSSPESVVGELTGYKESPDVMHDFSKNPDWRGPYLMNTRLSQHANGQRNQALIDPWRQKYQFKLRDPAHNKGSVDIWCPGPNIKDEQGDGDDVNNWSD